MFFCMLVHCVDTEEKCLYIFICCWQQSIDLDCVWLRITALQSEEMKEGIGKKECCGDAFLRRQKKTLPGCELSVNECSFLAHTCVLYCFPPKIRLKCSQIFRLFRFQFLISQIKEVLLISGGKQQSVLAKFKMTVDD